MGDREEPEAGAGKAALVFGATVLPLPDGLALVGRADPAGGTPGPDIDLAPFDPDRIVSRKHAHVHWADGVVKVRDAGSANGTFVDGERLEPGVARLVADGQEIRFGHLTFRLAAGPAGPQLSRAGGDTAVADPAILEVLGGLPQAHGTPERPHAQRAVVERIHRVLTGPQLTVVFQPIVDLARRQTVGVESLSRISAGPPSPPDVWFHDAFDVGLGVDLELAAIAVALRSLEVLPAPIYLGVNASPQTVMAPAFAALLGGFDLTRLVVEVTEHAAVADYAGLGAALAPLRQAGARLAIDDMGSGYASLAHVLRLDPDVVKLDVALVRGIDRDEARQALAGALVNFAADTGARLVAEGIETAEELAILVSLGVGYGQGYFLGRPGPLEALPLG